MQAIYAFILVAVIFVFAVFQTEGKKKYSDFFLPLDSKEYSYKGFLPGCLVISEKVKINGLAQYQAKLSQRIAMVYGNRNLPYYSKVHQAVKVFYTLLGVIISTLLCILGKVNYKGLFIIIAAGVGFFFLADKTLNDKYNSRKFEMEKDFPDFLSKLILLMNAGLNVRQAMMRIISKSDSDSCLYRELRTAVTDMEAGLSESEAYTGFAERCKIKQITNFVSILQQNLKLGGAQMVFELRRMNTECWEMRKNIAKQLGETASSKLMIPLSIMLLAVILICVAPVIIELGSAF